MNERLVWIDCEMTGLDLVNDALIEVAALVTDFELNVLGEGIDVVIKPPAAALEQMIDFVRSMHETSGLLELLDGGLAMAEAEEQVLAYIKEHCPDGSRPPLAGNTIATDRAFLARDMPTLEASCTTATSTSRRSRSCRGAGTRAPTSTPRRSAATTGRSPTSRRASRSCATTGRPSSCHSPVRTVPQPRRSPPVTAAS